MKEVLFASIVSFFITLVAGFILLPALRKIKATQPILSYVKEHEKKSGTPTMGGIFFLCGILIASLVFFKGNSRLAVVALSITIGYGIVGFLDDFIKIRLKNNKGLRAYQKILFQIALAGIASYFAYKNNQEIIIPFTDIRVELGAWIIPITAFIFLSVTNSVNLTDGLDGLAGGTTLIYAIFFGALLIFSANFFDLSGDTLKYLEYKNLSILTLSCCGALAAYLYFNVSPAKIFMGDTGSLALGGLIASLAVFTEYVLFVPLLGVMYVVSSVSVIIQVIYFKATKGKRVFLMSPYHHHLQHKGLSESKIMVIYMAVTAVIGIVIVAFTIY